MSKETPRLELGILLSTPTVPAGGELQVSLSLVNRGDAPVEAPSLQNNSVVTNYVISREDGEPVATVNDVSRQRLLGMDQRLELDEVRMRTFAPGEEETFLQNLQLLHWLDQPGTYLIQGLYAWQDLELRSAAVPLVVEPARITAHHHQWCYHYGEEYWLHTAWVHREGGTHNIALRESYLFNPHAINFNRQVFGQDEPCEPQVSLNATLLGSSHVWLTWLGGRGSQIHCLRTDQGEPADLPESYAVEIEQPELLAPTLMLEDLSLLVLLRGGGRVQGIRVGSDGKEQARQLLPDLFGRAVELQGLLDLDGAYHLLWTERHDEETHVMMVGLDPQTLALEGDPRQVLATQRRVLRLLAPPVQPVHEALACLLQDEPDRPHELALQRFHYLGAGSPPAPAPVLFPEDRPVERLEGRLDADGTFHLLALTEDHAVLYYNDHRDQVSTVAQLEEADLPTPLSLVLSPDNDAYAVFRRGDHGLQEVLVRTLEGDEYGAYEEDDEGDDRDDE